MKKVLFLLLLLPLIAHAQDGVLSDPSYIENRAGQFWQVRILAPGVLRIVVQSSNALVADVFFLPGTRCYVSLDETYILTVNNLTNPQGR